MRTIQQIILIFGFIYLFAATGCSKQELAVEPPPKVISLSIAGSTVNDTLEFVKGGKVIANSKTNQGEFSMTILVTSDGPEATIDIRRKGHQDLLATRKFSSSVFEQKLQCYYDGKKVYSNSISLKVKAYAAMNTLEFIIGDQVLATGTGANFPQTLNIGIENGETRQLQVRKQGSNVPILTKQISGDQTVQSLKFYYDGEKIIDKIDLVPPANPANIRVQASFTSTLNIYQGPADLVIYAGPGPFPEYTPLNIRIPLSEDGTLSEGIELPPLSVIGTDYAYKLVKRGTVNDLPYDVINEFQPIRPESGFAYLKFVAGRSMMLIVKDEKRILRNGSKKGTNFVITAVDIAEYFR